MKRLFMAIALCCALSIPVFAGDVPSVDLKAPDAAPSPQVTDANESGHAPDTLIGYVIQSSLSDIVSLYCSLVA